MRVQNWVGSRGGPDFLSEVVVSNHILSVGLMDNNLVASSCLFL